MLQSPEPLPLWIIHAIRFHQGFPSVWENILLNLFCSQAEFLCQCTFSVGDFLRKEFVNMIHFKQPHVKTAFSSHKFIEVQSVFVGFVYLIVITMSGIALSPTFPVLITPKCTAGNNHTLLIKAPISTKQMISMSIQLIKFQGQLSQQVY